MGLENIAQSEHTKRQHELASRLLRNPNCLSVEIEIEFWVNGRVVYAADVLETRLMSNGFLSKRVHEIKTGKSGKALIKSRSQAKIYFCCTKEADFKADYFIYHAPDKTVELWKRHMYG